MNFKGLIIGFIMAALVIICILTFASNFSSENNIENPISGSPILSSAMNNLTNNLQTTQQNATNSQNAFIKESSSPTITSLGFIFYSILSAGAIFINSSLGIVYSIFLTISQTFGVPPIIIGSIMAIIIITLIFAIWRVVRAGE